MRPPAQSTVNGFEASNCHPGLHVFERQTGGQRPRLRVVVVDDQQAQRPALRGNPPSGPTMTTRACTSWIHGILRATRNTLHGGTGRRRCLKRQPVRDFGLAGKKP